MTPDLVQIPKDRIFDCTGRAFSYSLLTEAHQKAWVGRQEPKEVRGNQATVKILLLRLQHPRKDGVVQELSLALGDIKVNGAKIVQDDSIQSGVLWLHNPERPDLDTMIVGVEY